MPAEEVETRPGLAEEEVWGCLPDSSEVYQLAYSTRDEALVALGGEAGAIVRCRRGLPREGLEYLFDLESLLSGVEERANLEGQVLADFEQGLLNPDVVQEDDLRRRLADTLHQWVQAMDPECWTIVESEDIEVPTNAQNPAP